MKFLLEIIGEPNRRAILSLLASSQQSVGEIERQLRMPQPTVSKHPRVLREAGFVESKLDAQRRLYRRNLNHFRIGVSEFLGGIGLIVRAMTGVKPKRTPFAALGRTLVMILAAVFHIVRANTNFVLINLVLGGVAAFIAYRRLFVRPIAPVDQHLPRTSKGPRFSARWSSSGDRHFKR